MSGGPDIVKEQRELFEKMQSQSSDTMDFLIQRDPEPGKTFSKEGLEGVRDAMLTFVGARLSRRFLDRPAGAPGVSRMRVTLRLELDGESLTVPDDEYPWYIINGEARMN